MPIYRDSLRLTAFLNKDYQLRAEALRKLDYGGYKRAKDKGNPANRLNLGKVWKRDKGRCYLCRTKLQFWVFTIDHVRPIAHGGGHTYGNVKVCCLKCNQQKGDKQNAEETATPCNLE